MVFEKERRGVNGKRNGIKFNEQVKRVENLNTGTWNIRGTNG